mmetsp:Transcript_677/g.845  ORF Transcript_677/g.845 Transcript_677/m.845 type:complete len:394 (-) Transcript_677:13-1194(-)
MRRRPTGASDDSISSATTDGNGSFWETKTVTSRIKRITQIVLLVCVVMALTYTLNGSSTGKVKGLRPHNPPHTQLEVENGESLHENVSQAGATPGEGGNNVDEDDDVSDAGNDVTVTPVHSHPRIILIGVGTGRCGTLSLSVILSLLRSSHVTHEYLHSEICKEWLWMASSEQERKEAAEKVIRRYNDSESEMIGDVAFYHLPYVEILLAMDKRVMVVFLEREKDGYVKSALKWFNHTRSYPFSHKIQRMIRGEDTIHTYVSSVDSFMACYPKYHTSSSSLPLNGDDNGGDGEINDFYRITGNKSPGITGSPNTSDIRNEGFDLSQGYKYYWESYHSAFASLKGKFPSRVRLLEMKNLNDDKAMRELVEWLGFSTQEMSGSVPHGIHEHKARS